MNDRNRVVLGFPEYREQGLALAQALRAPFADVRIHRFPDGESQVVLPENDARELIFCRSLDQPNDKLIELMLAAATGRQSGAERLTLVAPYLCYMRQDAAFEPGEAVSQRIVGGWLAQMFDGVLTVDPHLHRVDCLEHAVPARHAQWITAAGAIGAFLEDKIERPFLLGPDEESEQWVRIAAQARGLDYGIARKIRRGDRDVSIELPDVDLKYRHVVLIDDIASTGRTLAQAATATLAHGASHVSAAITHGLFADDALPHLRQSGIENIWTTDSVAHGTNTIQLADLLAQALDEPGLSVASAG